MTHIDYYFTMLSPYCYLAGTRLEDVANKHGATVNYKPFDVAQAFARTGGVSFKDRHVSRIEYRAQELPRQAKKLGLAFNISPAHWPTNGAPAAYAFIAAQNAGGGDLGMLAHILCRAVWAEDKDIAQDEVICACLSEAGFDPALVDSSMLQGSATFTKNLEDAISAGVFGAPFYIVEGQRFWGQDRIEDLDLYLQEKQ